MRSAMLIVLLAAAAGAAAAQDRFGEINNRYDANGVDGPLRVGVGAELVPLCTWRAGGWACVTEQESRAAPATPDERAAREIARLKDEVVALRQRLAAAGEPPAVLPAPRPAPGEAVPLTPPRRGVLTRIGDCLADAWRRVVDMIAGVFG